MIQETLDNNNFTDIKVDDAVKIEGGKYNTISSQFSLIYWRVRTLDDMLRYTIKHLALKKV